MIWEKKPLRCAQSTIPIQDTIFPRSWESQSRGTGSDFPHEVVHAGKSLLGKIYPALDCIDYRLQMLDASSRNKLTFGPVDGKAVVS